jgi:hypothetical protein
MLKQLRKYTKTETRIIRVFRLPNRNMLAWVGNYWVTRSRGIGSYIHRHLNLMWLHPNERRSVIK